MGAKKAANLFRIYCFVCRCGAAGYSVFIMVQCDKLKINKKIVLSNHQEISFVLPCETNALHFS